MTSSSMAGHLMNIDMVEQPDVFMLFKCFDMSIWSGTDDLVFIRNITWTHKLAMGHVFV